MPARRLLIVVNVGWFFVSHRLPIAIAAKGEGYDVHVASSLDPRLDGDTERLLAGCALRFHRLDLSRSDAGLFRLIREFLSIIRLYRQVRPDVVHLVTLKPVLLGGIAARLVGIRRVILAIPGRGSVFSARGVAVAFRRWVALAAYKFAYRSGHNRVIIQNVEDRDYFVSRRIFRARDVHLIRGSGVDLRRFVFRPPPQGRPQIVLASRMLKDKGIADFVAAASKLKRRGVDARFVLVGEPDHGNPRSHTREELQSWESSGVVEWWGYRSDMSEVLAASHIVCLPTVYGEGVPKVLIEAAACGRPIVTTDTPGCRDIVRQGLNGLLVGPNDVDALAAAIHQLLVDEELRAEMGRRGRVLVESEFGVERVVEQTLRVYQEILQ